MFNPQSPGIESDVNNIDESSLVNVPLNWVIIKSPFYSHVFTNTMPSAFLTIVFFLPNDVHSMHSEFLCLLLFATYKPYFQLQKILSMDLPMWVIISFVLQLVDWLCSSLEPNPLLQIFLSGLACWSIGPLLFTLQQLSHWPLLLFLRESPGWHISLLHFAQSYSGLLLKSWCQFSWG